MPDAPTDIQVSIGPQPFTHLGSTGAPHMVEISRKPITYREAVASGYVVMSPETLSRVMAGDVDKGDVLATARLAGITGAKRTSDLVPLCHPLCIEGVSMSFDAVESDRLRIRARAVINARAGVEMEVLTAVAAAALTVYGMCKSADRTMSITDIQIDEKSGGNSGQYRREE